MAIFTATLWQVTSKLYLAGERQIKLAERQFVATHRPRLIIRRCMVWIDYKTCIMMFELFNAGGSRAKILPSSGATLRMMGKSYRMFFSENMGSLQHSILEGKTMSAGAVVVENIPFGLQPYEWESFMIKSHADEANTPEMLIFYGRIVYSDDFGVTRRTGFWRKYDGPEGIFKPVNNPDYEFED